MENITADYKRLFLTDETPMTTFGNRISSGAYWTPTDSFSGVIESIAFNETPCDVASPYSQCFEEQGCSGQECHIYRITITQTSTGRKLSALFAD